MEGDPSLILQERPFLTRPGQFASLASFWLAYHFLWTAILPYVIPAKAEQLGGITNWGLFQGALLSAGALFSAVIQLTVGFISDHTESPWGNRKPFLFFGVLLFIPSIIFFFTANSFFTLLIGYLLVQLFVNTASVPYQALLPDLVPEDRHGMASAFMGIFDLGGKLLGMITIALLFTLPGLIDVPLLKSAQGLELVVLSFVYIALFVVLAGLVFLKVPSWPILPVRSRFLPLRIILFKDGVNTFHSVLANYLNFEFKKNLDFVYLLLSRTSVYFAFYMFVPNVYHFVRWNLGRNPEVLTPILLSAVILLGFFGNLIGGFLSDRVGKKPIVAVAVTSLAVFMFPLVFATDFTLALFLGTFIGVAWGAFLSADWAFACTLIPKQKTARYMGVWDLSTLIPQVIATMLTGVSHLLLVTYLQGEMAMRQALALKYIFSFAAVFFILGLAVLRFVKEPRLSRGLA